MHMQNFNFDLIDIHRNYKASFFSLHFILLKKSTKNDAKSIFFIILLYFQYCNHNFLRISICLALQGTNLPPPRPPQNSLNYTISYKTMGEKQCQRGPPIFSLFKCCLVSYHQQKIRHRAVISSYNKPSEQTRAGIKCRLLQDNF